MSLKIERNVSLVEGVTEISVRLTLMLAGVLEVVSYPGCWASVVGGNVNVYAYADGPHGRPRAAWQSPLVLGIENFGDHPGAHAKLAEQDAASKAERIPPRPPAGPDYPPRPDDRARLGLAPLSPDAAKELPVADAMRPRDLTEEFPVIHYKEDIVGTRTSQEVVQAPKVTVSVRSAERSSKTPTHLLARPGEAPAASLWTPRGRPTPHRALKPRRSAQPRRGRAMGMLQSVGAAMLLGFAVLGGSE